MCRAPAMGESDNARLTELYIAEALRGTGASSRVVLREKPQQKCRGCETAGVCLRRPGLRPDPRLRPSGGGSLLTCPQGEDGVRGGAPAAGGILTPSVASMPPAAGALPLDPVTRRPGP